MKNKNAGVLPAGNNENTANRDDVQCQNAEEELKTVKNEKPAKKECKPNDKLTSAIAENGRRLDITTYRDKDAPYWCPVCKEKVEVVSDGYPVYYKHK